MANLKTYKCDICGKVYHDESWDKNNRIVVEHWVDDEKSIDIYNDVCTECMEVINRVVDSPSILIDHCKRIDCLEGKLAHLRTLLNKIHCGMDGYPCIGADTIAENCIQTYSELKASKQRWKEAAILLGTWGLMAFILLWFI